MGISLSVCLFIYYKELDNTITDAEKPQNMQ